MTSYFAYICPTKKQNDSKNCKINFNKTTIRFIDNTTSNEFEKIEEFDEVFTDFSQVLAQIPKKGLYRLISFCSTDSCPSIASIKDITIQLLRIRFNNSPIPIAAGTIRNDQMYDMLSLDMDKCSSFEFLSTSSVSEASDLLDCSFDQIKKINNSIFVFRIGESAFFEWIIVPNCEKYANSSSLAGLPSNLKLIHVLSQGESLSASQFDRYRQLTCSYRLIADSFTDVTTGWVFHIAQQSQFLPNASVTKIMKWIRNTPPFRSGTHERSNLFSYKSHNCEEYMEEGDVLNGPGFDKEAIEAESQELQDEIMQLDPHALRYAKDQEAKRKKEQLKAAANQPEKLETVQNKENTPNDMKSNTEKKSSKQLKNDKKKKINEKKKMKEEQKKKRVQKLKEQEEASKAKEEEQVKEEEHHEEEIDTVESHAALQLLKEYRNKKNSAKFSKKSDEKINNSTLEMSPTKEQRIQDKLTKLKSISFSDDEESESEIDEQSFTGEESEDQKLGEWKTKLEIFLKLAYEGLKTARKSDFEIQEGELESLDQRVRDAIQELDSGRPERENEIKMSIKKLQEKKRRHRTRARLVKEMRETYYDLYLERVHKQTEEKWIEKQKTQADKRKRALISACGRREYEVAITVLKKEIEKVKKENESLKPKYRKKWEK